MKYIIAKLAVFPVVCKHCAFIYSFLGQSLHISAKSSNFAPALFAKPQCDGELSNQIINNLI